MQSLSFVIIIMVRRRNAKACVISRLSFYGGDTTTNSMDFASIATLGILTMQQECSNTWLRAVIAYREYNSNFKKFLRLSVCPIMSDFTETAAAMLSEQGLVGQSQHESSVGISLQAYVNDSCQLLRDRLQCKHIEHVLGRQHHQ